MKVGEQMMKLSGKLTCQPYVRSLDSAIDIIQNYKRIIINHSFFTETVLFKAIDKQSTLKRAQFRTVMYEAIYMSCKSHIP